MSDFVPYDDKANDVSRPSTGVERRISRAQSTRINGLTRAARQRVNEQRRQAIEDAKTSQADGTSLNLSFNEAEQAPPPYTSLAEVQRVLPVEKQSSVPSVEGSVQPQSNEIAANNDSETAPTKKNSRYAWMRRGKRSSSKQDTSQSSNDGVNGSVGVSVVSAELPAVALTSWTDKDQVQATPAVIDQSDQATDYFEQQSGSAPARKHTADSLQDSKDYVDSSMLQSNNPYLALRLGSSKSETDFNQMNTSYSELALKNTKDFDAIRPSQRVLAQRKSSAGLSNTPAPAAPLPALASRISSFLGWGNSEPVQQSWQTITMTEKPLIFKVVFDKESFQNKMSASAARALGVADSIIVYDQVPTAELTLLHAVSDEIDEGETVINGDQAEFVVMDEFESRVPLLSLGASLSHLADLMRERQSVYWSPRPVPENLRTIERLRACKYFELAES